MKRILSYLLVIALFFSFCDVYAIAEFVMPSALKEIGSFAYAYDESLSGVITVPSKVQSVGSYAFYGTDIYALKIGNSCTYVGSCVAAGAVYVMATGASTNFENDALCDVRYAFGSTKSNMSGAGASEFFDVSKLTEEDGFYYYINGDSATLLCAVDAGKIGSYVTIPESVNGKNIAIAADAFVGCSNIIELSVNKNTVCDNNAFDSISDAQIIFYGDDITVAYLKSDIGSVTEGGTVTWVAAVTNATGAVSYDYEVYYVDNDTETLYYSVYSSNRNYISVALDAPGEYYAVCRVSDQSGSTDTAYSKSVAVDCGSIVVTEFQPAEAEFIQDKECTWTGTTAGGHGENTYTITITSNGTVIETVSGLSYTASNYTPGKYTISFTAQDKDGCTAAAETTFTVISSIEAYPAAPLLTSGNLGETEADAPEIEQTTISIAWEKVEYAQFYGIIVEKQNGSAWESVAEYDGITKLSYNLASSLFAAEDTTLFRVGLYSKNIGSGETAWHYISVKPRYIDTAIYVDGKEVTNSDYYKCYYSLTDSASFCLEVSSEYDWSFSASADWFSVSRTDNLLLIDVTENTSGKTRSAYIDLTNGMGSAQIYVWQGNAARAPRITYPYDLSTDSTNPTSVGTSAFVVNVDRANYSNADVVVYLNGKEVYRQTVSDNEDKIINYSFADGNTYRIDITGYKTNSKYEPEEAHLTTSYYIKADKANDFMLINDANALALIVNGTTSDFININNNGIAYTAVSDEDWLTLNAKDAKDTLVNAVCTPNMTSEARTGHIVFKSGTAQAVLTVTQFSMLPAVIAPELATSSSSPTSIKPADLALVWSGESIVVEKYANSKYTEIASASESGYGANRKLSIDSDALASSATYRVTVSYNGQNSVYWFKVSSSTSTISLDGETTLILDDVASAGTTNDVKLVSGASWTASSDSDWLTVSSKSGSSTTNGKTIKITVAPNDTASPRSGIVAFKTSKYAAYLVVNQCAGGIYASFDDGGAQLTVSGKGQRVSYSESISLTGYGNVTVASDSAWLTITEDSATYSTEIEYPIQIRYYLAENTTGKARTATITVTHRLGSSVLTVTQLPSVGTPSFTGVDYSRIQSAPTLIENTGKLALSWTSLPGAVKYVIYSYGYNYTFDGSVSSCVIDTSKLRTGSVYTIYVTAYDSLGSSYRSEECYIQFVESNKVLLNGEENPAWNDADDAGEQNSYIVQCLGSWTASTSASWITLSKSSGSAGDELTVMVANNSGMARTGTVTVRYGDAYSTLTVNQCAYLSEDFPGLVSPVLSTDIGNITVLPTDMDSITFTWDAAPQATYRILIKRDSTKIDSGSIKGSSWTNESIKFRNGEIYTVNFMRNSKRWGKQNIYYYFTLDDGNAAVWLNSSKNTTAIVKELYEEGEELGVYVGATGDWVALPDSDWLFVSTDDNDNLDDILNDPEDYLYCEEHISWSGAETRLGVYATANNTGSARTGTITIRCGSAVATITVKQSTSYKAAELTNITLGDTPKNSVKIPYGSIYLAWSAAENGTGMYSIELEEKSGSRSYYDRIMRDKVRGRSYTISKDLLKEGTEYRLYLYSEIKGESEMVGATYYFNTAYANELTVSMSCDWSGNYVDLNASASGGSSRGYQYAYVLYKGNSRVDMSEYSNSARYGFSVDTSGDYRVVCYVRDSAGNEATVESSRTVSPDDIYKVSVSSNMVDFGAEPETKTVTVTATGSWSAKASQNWITCTKNGSSLSISVERNTTGSPRYANVAVTCGNAAEYISIGQGAPVNNDRISLDSTVWKVDSVYAESKSVQITSTDSWYISEDTVPAWISFDKSSGVSGSIVSLVCAANNGAARSASLVFVCSGASAMLTISQPGKEADSVILSAQVANGTAVVGWPVSFQVRTKNADTVTMVVDSQYTVGNYSVMNGSNTFEYTFSQGGDRQIELIPSRNGVAGESYSFGILNVGDNGPLDTPNLSYKSTQISGQTQFVTWKSITGASGYTVYLSHEGITNTYMCPAEKTSFELSPDVLSGLGNYTVLVVAYGIGYSQSEAAAIITVKSPEINFRITSPTSSYSYTKGDPVYITVDNPDEYNLAVLVTSSKAEEGSFWLPGDGTTLNTEEVYVSFVPRFEATYTIEAMAWANKERGEVKSAWHDASKAINISVNGPIARSLKINGRAAGVYLDDESFELEFTTNGIVTEVEYYLDGALIPASDKDTCEQSGWNLVWTKQIAAPASQQKHTVKVIGKDADGVKVDRSIEFYCVKAVPVSTMYAKDKNAVIYSTPGKSSNSAMPMMTPALILGVYGEYCYIAGSHSGFVKANLLSDTIVYDSDSIKLTFDSPCDPIIYTYTGGPAVRFRWHCNVIPSNDVYYRLTLTARYPHDTVYTFDTTDTYIDISPDELHDAEGVRVKLALIDRSSGKEITACCLKHYVDGATSNVSNASDESIWENFPTKAEWRKAVSANDLEQIEIRSETFKNSNRSFASMGNMTNIGTFIYLLANFELKEFESKETQSDSLAYSIMLQLGGARYSKNPYSSRLVALEYITNALQLFQLPSDVISIITIALEDAKVLVNGAFVIDLSKCSTLTAKLLKLFKLAENQAAMTRFLGWLGQEGVTIGKIGDAVSKIVCVVNLILILLDVVSACAVFAQIDYSDILIIANELISSNDPVLRMTGIKLESYDTTGKRVGLAVKYFGWDVFRTLVLQGFSELSTSKDLLASKGGASFGACYLVYSCGLSLINISGIDSEFKANYEAKWAIESADEYLSVFNVKLDAFMHNPSYNAYCDYIIAILTYQQLIINAYDKLINAVDNYHKSNDEKEKTIEGLIECETRFISNTNLLLGSLDDYYYAYLNTDGRRFDYTPAKMPIS